MRLLVKIGAWILGSGYSDDEPRADMYLPIWLLAFALVLLVGGAGVGIYGAVVLSLGAILGGVAAFALGVLALLCWKNQSITMLPNDSFEYTTFLGNKRTYRFSEIKGLRRNSDSMTLFVGDGKVHMESCAIISDRLAERINQQLEEIYREED